MIILCDVNAMYVSCELVFAPYLRGKACAVLSNGDGIVVAANRIAIKEKGLKKFAPAFQQQHLLGKSVEYFSSNYELYSKMSQNLFSCLQSTELLSELHPYSIDEVFGALPENFNWEHADLIDVARQLRRTAWQETRLPIGVGIGRSFTLSKVSSYIGKNIEGYRGICVMSDEQTELMLLKKVPVSAVWNVGKATATSLARYNIQTAFDLRNFSLDKARELHGVNLMRTIQELRGERVFSFDSFPDIESRKEVTSSLSLTVRARTKQELHQALAQRIAVASEKLRKLGFTARTMVLYANSNRHKAGYRSFQRTRCFDYPIDDTRVFIKALSDELPWMYEREIEYYKVGCRLLGLEHTSHQQIDLFAPAQDSKLMELVDSLNQRYGQHVMTVAAQTVDSKAAMLREHLSPNYLTRWADIPKISC